MRTRVAVVVAIAVGAVVGAFPLPAHAENTLTVEPLVAPLGTERTLRASGDFVDDHFEKNFYVLVGGSRDGSCEKPNQFLLGKRVVCTFNDRGVPGHQVVRLAVTNIGGDLIGPQSGDIWAVVDTTTTQPSTTPTTAGSQPTPTQPAASSTTTVPEPPDSTTVPTESTTTTEGVTTTTEAPPTTDPPLAAPEDPRDPGGPSWLTVGLIVALAVAISVIVMQNLPRSRDPD